MGEGPGLLPEPRLWLRREAGCVQADARRGLWEGSGTSALFLHRQPVAGLSSAGSWAGIGRCSTIA